MISPSNGALSVVAQNLSITIRSARIEQPILGHLQRKLSGEIEGHSLPVSAASRIWHPESSIQNQRSSISFFPNSSSWVHRFWPANLSRSRRRETRRHHTEVSMAFSAFTSVAPGFPNSCASRWKKITATARGTATVTNAVGTPRVSVVRCQVRRRNLSLW